MACCNVNRCCCCVEHTLGVKLLALFLILLEVVYIFLTVQLKPSFTTYVAVACAAGFFSHILLLIAVYRVQRWLCIPWLIYVMLVVVALCLISVLQVVISLGASNADPDWLEIVIVSAGCLALAGMYLYFWIVVLELFIKLGPLYYMAPGQGGPPPMGPMPPGMMHVMSPYGPQSMAPPVPVHAVVYDSRPPQDGPQSMFATPTGGFQGAPPGGGMYGHQQQPNSLPPVFYQTNVRQY